jgi:hypothetical protein
MARTRGSYPHPVLDTSDDVASTFELLNVSSAPTVDDIEVRFEIRSDDPELQKLLARKEARYSFRWKCGATLATGELEPVPDGHTAEGTRFVAWLDQREVRGTVSVEVRVIADQEITGHHWSRQNSEYGGAKFDHGVGDLLADGGSFSFVADKLYDPLDPPIGSCFQFVPDPSVKRNVELSFLDDEVVKVRFPEKDFPGLAAMSANPVVQIGSVVLPALMETISTVRRSRDSGSEELEDMAWARTITTLVQQAGGFEKSSFELAQKILDRPINKILIQFLEGAEDEE